MATAAAAADGAASDLDRLSAGTFALGFLDRLRGRLRVHRRHLRAPRRRRWSRCRRAPRWQDESAGGAPQYCSWRHNYQWPRTIKRVRADDPAVCSGAATRAAPPTRTPSRLARRPFLRGNDGDAAMQARAHAVRAALARRRPPTSHCRGDGGGGAAAARMHNSAKPSTAASADARRAPPPTPLPPHVR